AFLYVRRWETPPHRGAPIWKDRDMANTRNAAGRSAFLLRPLCQAPGLELPSPHRRPARTSAPVEDRQGEARARRCRVAHAVAPLGLRQQQGRARRSGVALSYPPLEGEDRPSSEAKAVGVG